MAQAIQYKKTKRGSRIASVENDFSKGMMFTDGTVSEGYVKTLVNFDFTTDGKNALKPRASLRPSEIVIPNYKRPAVNDNYLADDVTIKYSKECSEGSEVYYQFILGDSEGNIWVETAKKDSDRDINVSSIPIDLLSSVGDKESVKVTVDNSLAKDIHNVNAIGTVEPIGAFLGNSFYYFSIGSSGERRLSKTTFNEAGTPFYYFNFINELSVSASEAVTYGYNMLSSNPYEFDNGYNASTMQMEGILPYDGYHENRKLLMTPKYNSRIYFECFYDVAPENTYLIKWSWKEVAADQWNVVYKEEQWSSGEDSTLRADFVPPASEIMVRCEAYRYVDDELEDAVEKAMVVGFDFSRKDNNSALNVEQANYDLTTAKGMCPWSKRLVLWGVKDAENILFVSDMNEPTYFPYPNNVEIFDDSIISAVELMGNLMVVTTNRIYQVSFNSDGLGFTTEAVQSNLYINPGDKHLIKAVRNMLYFKSGNYYYMLVPKSQSTTGELTIAPITTPITDFFNKFSVNTSSVFRECFKALVDDILIIHEPVKLATYFDYLDYEFIHNTYVYLYPSVMSGDYDRYVHFDIMYNHVNRYWKIHIYEAPHILHPFRNDATQQGCMATTDTFEVGDSSRRLITIYEYSLDSCEDKYYTNLSNFVYDEFNSPVFVFDGIAELPSLFEFEDDNDDGLGILIEPTEGADRADVDDIVNNIGCLYIRTSENYINGFVISGENSIEASIESADDSLELIFSNRQMLDTGYRDAAPFINKRYRELQLQVNNLGNSDMEFGMDFNIAGEPRKTEFVYEVSQTVDEMDDQFGIAYLDVVPYLTDSAERLDKSNLWTIHQALMPDVSLWKIRASVSGKGVAPRLRLFTRRQFDYQLLGINWIYREMNMR